MSRDVLQENIYWNLFQVCMRAKYAMIQFAETYELGLMQLYTLCSMEPDKPVPMNSISAWLGCDASNVTGIIDRLFVRKLIVREESAYDRRVKMISLTSEGVELRQKILAELHDYEPGVLEKLKSSQRAELAKLVHLVLESSRL